jgi:hypothetical protein|tara:strand:- start:37506 stop:37892 length:387 start_codon:yes stop_codon:yes gene_type:complete
MLKSKFISDILTLLLDGDEEGILAAKQIPFLEESDYEYTGGGVCIGFSTSKGILDFKVKTKEKLILDGVKIESPELEDGANCILFFENGIIDFLEIDSRSGNYPNKELSKYKLIQKWKGSPKKEIVCL